MPGPYIYDNQNLKLVQFALKEYLNDYKDNLIRMKYFDAYFFMTKEKMDLKSEEEKDYEIEKNIAENAVASDERWINSADFDFWARSTVNRKTVIKFYRNKYLKDFDDLDMPTKIEVIQTLFGFEKKKIKDLSSLLGVGYKTASRYLRGHKEPDEKTIYKMAVFVGIKKENEDEGK